MVGLYRYLAKWTGNKNPVAAFRLHRRNIGQQNDYLDVAGRFAGEIPLRLSLESEVSEQVGLFQNLFRKIPSGGLTYEILAYQGLLPVARNVSPIVVNYQPYSMSSLPQDILDTLKVRQFESSEHDRFYQIDLIVRENKDQIVIIAKYSRNQFEDSTIENIVHEWRQMTEAVISEMNK